MGMYTLMRKNDEIMLFQIGSDGNIIKIGKKMNDDLIPLRRKCCKNRSGIHGSEHSDQELEGNIPFLS